MDTLSFKSFLKQAQAEGASAYDICEVIKQATNEQIDPQEIEALLAQLSQHGGADGHGEQIAPHGEGHQELMDPNGPPMGDPGTAGNPPHPHHGGPPMSHEHTGHTLPISEEELDQLAALIAEHMQAQQGGAAGPEAGLPPEAHQGLDLAKQGSYISGFLKKAMEYGLDLDQSINLYADEYSQTFNTIKEASDRDSDIKKVASNVDEQILSYFQGVGEKAAAMNFSYQDTLAVLKEAGAIDLLINKMQELAVEKK